MLSKFKLLALAAATLTLSACSVSQTPNTDHAEDNIIGQNLSSVSSTTNETGADQATIAMYDSVVCRIHQFDMSTGEWQRTLKPRVVGGNHKVMFEPHGNYVIDVVDANLTVFDAKGQAQDPGLVFAGRPTNASFRPALGYMVMQDDSKTAALMRIASDGTVSGTATLGQIISSGVNMLAGDIDDSGNLILALSDGNIAVIDIAQSLATQAWVMSYKFASGLTNINWLAPMHDGSHQILVKTQEDSTNSVTVAVFDTVAKTQVGSSLVVPGSRRVIKTSKLYDPHLVVRDYTDSASAVSNVIYVQGGTLRSQPILGPIRNILSSRINIASNTWTMVDTDATKIWDGWRWYNHILYDDYNIVQQNRLLKRYSLSSMGLLKRYVIPDTTQIQIGESKIFQLFPSKLGKVTSTDIVNNTEEKGKSQFNYPFLHEQPCR